MRSIAFALPAALLLAGCQTTETTTGRLSPAGSGVASFYHEPQGLACERGRFDPDGLTAAHRTLPCGSRVRVTHARTGANVVVRINDRGPATWTGRVIDLSRGAAARIGMIQSGVAPVHLERLHE